MPEFSRLSKERLKSCHSDLQILFNEVIKHRDCSVICGHRGEEEQNRAFRLGNSKKQFPNSLHNMEPSLAVDVAPYESGIDWGKLQSAEFSGYVQAVADLLFDQGVMKHKIRRGADWDGDYDIDDTEFWDACHFEIKAN